MTASEFVRAYYGYAKDTERKTGIDARFTLAQAALESAWGKSAPGNMFFGVKASKNTPDSKKQLLATTEYFNNDKQGYRFPEVVSIERQPNGKYKYRVKDWFRKYDSPEECFTDHADFFIRNPRYAYALTVKHDPYKFAEEIAKGGYATAPDYAAVLKSLIKTIEKNLV